MGKEDDNLRGTGADDVMGTLEPGDATATPAVSPTVASDAALPTGENEERQGGEERKTAREWVMEVLGNTRQGRMAIRKHLEKEEEMKKEGGDKRQVEAAAAAAPAAPAAAAAPAAPAAATPAAEATVSPWAGAPASASAAASAAAAQAVAPAVATGTRPFHTGTRPFHPPPDVAPEGYIWVRERIYQLYDGGTHERWAELMRAGPGPGLPGPPSPRPPRDPIGSNATGSNATGSQPTPPDAR